MNPKRQFATQALILTLVCNALLLALLLFLAGDALAGQRSLIIGAGAVLTLVLWLALQGLGKRYIGQEAPAVAVETPKAPSTVTRMAPPSDDAALHLLAILQRKGRFIDFIQEDLGPYEDAEIGAVVRSVHEGCRQALMEYITLEPIYDENEGNQVTVEPGFDAHAVRLTGNIVGNPPFKGSLRHRGWRVANIDLPMRTDTAREQLRVLAPAEIEVNG